MSGAKFNDDFIEHRIQRFVIRANFPALTLQHSIGARLRGRWLHSAECAAVNSALARQLLRNAS